MLQMYKATASASSLENLYFGRTQLFHYHIYFEVVLCFWKEGYTVYIIFQNLVVWISKN